MRPLSRREPPRRSDASSWSSRRSRHPDDQRAGERRRDRPRPAAPKATIGSPTSTMTNPSGVRVHVRCSGDQGHRRPGPGRAGDVGVPVGPLPRQGRRRPLLLAWRVDAHAHDLRQVAVRQADRLSGRCVGPPRAMRAIVGMDQNAMEPPRDGAPMSGRGCGRPHAGAAPPWPLVGHRRRDTSTPRSSAATCVVS